MKALVTGATGFIGETLLGRLEAPRVLSRSPERARRALPGTEVFPWDPMGGPPPTEALAGVDTIFHLAGEPVAGGRWNERRKAAIRDSRVVGTRHLVDGLAAADPRPRVLVAASAVGFYGDRGDEVLDEGAAPGTGFLAEVCGQWETESMRAAALGVRVVCIRIGVVLGRGGGALGQMMLPFKLGLGGRLGGGRQWMPWIHRDDLVGLMLHAAAMDDLRGPVNGVAPGEATNGAFTKALGRALHRPTIFPVPAFALRLAVGEFAEILLASQRVVPRAALDSGFSFAYPDVGPALEACT